MSTTIRWMPAAVVCFAVLLFAASACNEDTDDSEPHYGDNPYSIPDGDEDSDSSSGQSQIIDCPSLQDLAGGYSWITSIDVGDDPSLCQYMDCDIDTVYWNGGLYIDENGLLRMGLRYVNTYASSRMQIHITGKAQMTSCNTMVLSEVFDYADDCQMQSFHRGTGWRDPVEVDTDNPQLTFHLKLFASGALLMNHSLEWYGGQFPWEPDYEITANNADFEYDEDFKGPLCDPLTQTSCECACQPNSTACQDSSHVIVCDESGNPNTYDCDTACSNDGYGTSQGCSERNGEELCWCDYEPCYEEPGTRECVNDMRVRICSAEGTWFPKDCNDDCADYGFGPAIDCRWIEESSMYDCWCESN